MSFLPPGFFLFPRVIVVHAAASTHPLTRTHNHGRNEPTNRLSDQRLSMAPMYFSLDPDPAHPAPEFLSAGLYALGVIFTLGVATGALFLGFRKAPLEGGKGGSVGGAQVSKGPGGRSLVASVNSYFFASREHEGAAAAAGLGTLEGSRGATVVRVGGGGVEGSGGDLEELAKVTERVFSPARPVAGSEGGGVGGGPGGETGDPTPR